MVNIIELGITLLILLVGNKVTDHYKSDMIEMHLKNGDIFYFELHKNNKYSCPSKCKVEHHHSTYIITDMNINNSNIIVYDKVNKTLFLDKKEVTHIYSFVKKGNNKMKEKNDRVKVDISSFIRKYD